MRRVVRGFWGPRQESTEALAARWSTTLTRFAELLPAAVRRNADDGARTWHTTESVPVQPDEKSLLDALRQAQSADDWSAADGTSLRLLAADPAPGWKLEIAVLAGGTPQYLLQSLVATIVAPDDARLPDADLLTAVAETWHPDYGDVSDRAVTAALKKEAGFKIGTPSIGWVGYLSPTRASRVPAALASTVRQLPPADGPLGALLSITHPGDTDAVVGAYVSLKASGALDPLPQPMNRPTL
ncbi:Imm52 family immunity protein [Streptomyces sp. NPDC052013]|uniref:Imm52 family immunity protein n=1 Tax=Streptomyces sp. NPDC052013 TaxID=3365679 RepID=UPI0037CF5B77